MVSKSSREIEEMRFLISQGLLPKDAIDQHYEQEYQQTFGQDYKVDAEGMSIEQGRGSKAQPTRSSIDAYIKNQTERRAGRPGKGVRGEPRAHGSRSCGVQRQQAAAGQASSGPAQRGVNAEQQWQSCLVRANDDRDRRNKLNAALPCRHPALMCDAGFGRCTATAGQLCLWQRQCHEYRMPRLSSLRPVRHCASM